MPFWSDVRYSVRSFARTPALAATLVLTIGLGIGTNASLFGFIGGLISFELAGANPDAASRLVRVAILLASASGLLLLLACATVAGLLLGRTHARTPEMAVRLALGASRRSLARLALADAVVIAVAGGLLGLLLAWWTVFLLPLLFFAQDAEHLSMAPNRLWMAIAFAVWIAVVILAVMVPVFAVTRQAPSSVLQRETSDASRARPGLRRRLVQVQIAVSTLLLVAAAAIQADVQATLRTARGLALGPVLVAPVEAFPPPDTGPTYLAELQDRAAALPGVTGTVLTSSLPGGWAPSKPYRIERSMPRSRRLSLDVSTFDPSLAGPQGRVPIAGRHFSGLDGPGACRVGLLNQTAADEYFDGDAVGSVLEAAGGQLVEIIGVLRSPADAAEPGRSALFYHANQIMLPGVHRDQPFYAIAQNERPHAELEVTFATGGYFSFFADPVIVGRGFEETDDAWACRVGIISEVAAHTWFENDPVGGALIDPDGTRITIVGVVRASPLAAAQRAAAPALVLAHEQWDERHMILAARAQSPDETLQQALETAVLSTSGGRPLGRVRTLEEYLVATSLAPERISTGLIGLCAAMALAIAVVGVHGAMNDLVVRRRRELALRLALGAGAARLVARVIREGAQIALVGMSAGILAGGLAVPVLGMLIRRPPLPGPLVVTATAVVISALVLSACAVPAWRAIRVSPRELLQE